MKKYNASFTDGADRSWELTINAENWKAAHKDAVSYAKQENLKLWSVRLCK